METSNAVIAKPPDCSTVQAWLHRALEPLATNLAAIVRSTSEKLVLPRFTRALCCLMAKEHFFHAQTPALLKKLEELAHRSHMSRGQAFEDWLTAMVCALAAETKEAEYLAMVERHKRGKPGQRGIDLFGELFAELLLAMEKSDGDILGDLFEGAISYGENGLFLTPENLAQCMALLSLDEGARPPSDAPLYVNDPCCGTGRLLLEAAKVNPRVELVGQDIDPRCVKITAINLGLRSRYGWVICGNTLTNEMYFGYRVGSFYHETPNGLRRGAIRDVPIDATPVKGVVEDVPGAASEVAKADSDTDELVAMQRLSIIEVPQWLARLEPMFARHGQVGRRGQDEGSEPQREQGMANAESGIVLTASEGNVERGAAIMPNVQRTLFDE